MARKNRRDLGTSCLAASVVMEAPLGSGTQRKRLHFGVLQNLPLPIVSALSPHITAESTWISNSVLQRTSELFPKSDSARSNGSTRSMTPNKANGNLIARQTELHHSGSGVSLALRYGTRGSKDSGRFHQDICLLNMNQTSTKATRLSEPDAAARETGKSLRDKSLVHAMLRK